MRFRVTEPDGSKPDLRQIVLTEEWAETLMYSDMDGFYLGEDGALVLLDQCGNWAGCPVGRFRVEWNEIQEVKHEAI